MGRLDPQQRGSEYRLPRQLLQFLLGGVLLQVRDGHGVLVGEHAQVDQAAPLQSGLLDVASNELGGWLVVRSAVVLRPEHRSHSVRVHDAALPPQQLGVQQPLPPHLKQDVLVLERQHRDEAVPLNSAMRRQVGREVCRQTWTSVRTA